MFMTVGIPAYRAQDHICDCLASIQMQNIRDEVEVVIAKDDPEDDYGFVIDRFPDLNIKILECEKNTGPGLARQRCADAATTDWITYIDADDVFFSPVALERLKYGITPDCIEVQGTFLQEIQISGGPTQFMPHEGVEHPWVFGRLYNTKFLRDTGIKFSELRAIN